MSNVVTLHPVVQQTEHDRTARLIAGFAQHRRGQDDVFWLKENAELLNILAATKAQVTPDALAPFAQFYEQIVDRIAFFPQYYRFLLSLCLDLEALGMTGNHGATVGAWVAEQNLADAELSDLQRAEAFRLLARAGVDVPIDAALDARLRDFMRRTQTFALPNKKAAYELTHIVFYLSEYGQQDPQLDRKACTSLTYAGLLAYLDQNVDLLAEICTALRFANQTPPPEWERAVAQAHRTARVQAAPDGAQADNYHEYFVTGWAMMAAGQPAFQTAMPEGGVQITVGTPQGALRSLSECMFELGRARSGSWDKMRPRVLQSLGPNGQAVLSGAEASTEVFEPFFECFARAQ